jgi:hypothetical protein
MNIVLLAQQSLLGFVTRLLGHMDPVAKPMAYANGRTQFPLKNAPKNIASYAIPARAEGSFSLKTTAKPLRVVRVVETGQARASVGRMVISGRMADVCAELDRLAACEAALT